MLRGAIASLFVKYGVLRKHLGSGHRNPILVVFVHAVVSQNGCHCIAGREERLYCGL